MHSALHLEGIIELLHLRQNEHKPQHNEQHDEELAGEVDWRDVSIAHCTDRDQYKPQGIEEAEILAVQFNMVQDAHPVRREGGREGGKERGEKKGRK